MKNIIKKEQVMYKRIPLKMTCHKILMKRYQNNRVIKEEASKKAFRDLVI